MTDRPRYGRLRSGQKVTSPAIEQLLDDFYLATGQCCAGCDWWRWLNSLIGECTKSAPVSGTDRTEMLGITGCSLPVGTGHVLTRRDHHCGDFVDTHDWDIDIG